MAYCRFNSGLDATIVASDLYVYQTGHPSGGTQYVIHVAARRQVKDYPSMPERGNKPEKHFKREIDNWVNRSEDAFLPIGLPHDDATIFAPNLRSLLMEMQRLREEGYRVPEYALDRIRREMMDEEFERNKRNQARKDGRH